MKWKYYSKIDNTNTGTFMYLINNYKLHVVWEVKILNENNNSMWKFKI